MAKVIGTIASPIHAGELGNSFKPSTALSTEMLGVIKPSPNKSPAPNMAKSTIVRVRRPRPLFSDLGISDSKENIPPSP